jgi:metal-sulfur cluster biosynthetic enzyme
MKSSEENIYKCLSKVIDPELNIDIVSMGLIYDVTISTVQNQQGAQEKIHVLMSLTTPGCPLAGVLKQMVLDQISEIDGINPKEDVDVEITFDPPWMMDMMTEEARAELGY